MNSLTDSVLAMPDVQSSADDRHLPIQRVGVRGVRYPMMLHSPQGPMPTVAEWELAVALPATEKGTHMSRFVALLDEHRSTVMTPARFCGLAREMLPLLNAERGDITATFPYFMRKEAPVSGVPSLMDYRLSWTVRADASCDHAEFELVAQIPVTSLCPCSKAISEHGAHNQRSHVTVHALYADQAVVDLDALIRTVEAQASCELWGLLKRTDEKYVTERAYENPKFVEDLVRDVASAVQELVGDQLRRLRIEAENFESIHNHSAYAALELGSA